MHSIRNSEVDRELRDMPQNIWINWAFEASKHVYFPSKVEKNNASESEDEVEHFLDYLLKEVEQHQ